MADLRITDSNDVERATLSISEYKIKREGFNVIPQADVTVTRDDLNTVSGLAPGEDRAYIESNGSDIFGGIIKSPERQGGVAVITVRGKEQYMVRAPSVPTGQQKVNADDSTLIEEVVDATPQLTKGTIETVESGQTWVFGGISQWEKAKKVANTAGGEIEVTPAGVVNYRAQIGSDKTSTTLSPANGSFVEDTFVVSRDGVSGNTTHILITGVGQGSAQIEVAVVPDSDSNTYSQYDRVETYTHPTWSDGDDAIWGQPRSSKELKNADLAAAFGVSLIAELQDAEVRVDTRVKGEVVNLGDRFHVRHPEEDVDEDLRVVEVIERLAASGGTRFETIFSNYEFAHRDPAREDHVDTRDYAGGAYEGDLTRLQDGPGRGPVDASHNYVLSVDYPDDVVHEVDAEVHIRGLNYRAFAEGAAAGGDHDHDVPVSITTGSSAPDSDNATMEFTRSSMSGSLAQLTVPSVSGEGVIVLAYAAIQNTSTSAYDAELDIDNINTSTSLYDGVDETFNPDEMRFYEAVQTGSNLEGDTIEFQLNKSLAEESLMSAGLMVLSDHVHGVSATETSDASGDHTHSVNAGIIDFDGVDASPAHYPENIGFRVNGSPVSPTVTFDSGVDDGTQDFEAVADFNGFLSPGWNTIEITSDGLGHLDATYSADLFRQSL